VKGTIKENNVTLQVSGPTDGLAQRPAPTDGLAQRPAPTDGEGSRTPWERRLLLGLAGIYLALAVTYSFVIPLGYGPDEPRHYAYVKRLVERGQLPRLVHGVEADGAIVLHPPLYYVLLTPFYALLRGFGDATVQRVLRFLSPLLCGTALWLFYATLRRLFPDRLALRLGTIGITAFLPHLQLESAVINNDTLTILLGALLVWELARLRDRSPSVKESLLFGLTLAALANTKATGLTLSPLWAVWLWSRWGWRGLGQRAFWQALVLGYGPLVLLGTWWYLRNVVRYGQLVPFPDGFGPADWHTGHVYTPGELLWHGLLFVGPFWWLVGRAIRGLFLSVWTQVGWFPNALHTYLYALLGLLLAAAGGGHGLWWRDLRRGKETASAIYSRGVWVTFLAFALVYANVVVIAVFTHIGFYQGGRYTLPAIWGLSLFLGLGLERLAMTPRGKAMLFGGVGAFFLLLNGLCLYNLITYLNPLYGPQ
jgi:4-amino-4-deoxy-L-arabinose transferase-like glycosyltransferase